jgi:two-component system LytT family response regulator
VHRSFIIAVSKIDTLQDGGIVLDGKFVPVADAYRKALNTRMNVF